MEVCEGGSGDPRIPVRVQGRLCQRVIQHLAGMETMGTCHRVGAWVKTHQLQGLPTVTQGAGGTRHIPPGESPHQKDPPVKITHGISGLLHQEEGWLTLACTGLLSLECSHNQEPVPNSTHL